MKRIVCFTMALLMVLSCMAISAAAYIKNDNTVSNSTSMDDFVITPYDTKGTEVVGTGFANGKTLLTETVYSNQQVFKLGADSGQSGTNGILKIKDLTLNAKDYNYVLIRCYYDTSKVTSKGNPAVVFEPGDWYEQKPTNSSVPANEWVTLVVPIKQTTSMNESTKINAATFMMHGNQGNNIYCDVYISSVTFSQDATVDAPVDSYPIAMAGTQLTAVENNEFDIRMVATTNRNLDYTQYSAIGYKITAHSSANSQKREWDVTGNTVYTGVQGGTTTYRATDYGADHLAVFELQNVPADETVTLEVVPYLVKKSGDKVYGISAKLNYVNAAYVSGNYFYGLSPNASSQAFDADVPYLQQLDNTAALMKNNVLSAKPELSHVTGTTYYVSNNGSASNNGTSKDTPVKDLSNLQSKLKSGDAVLFERGGIWRGKYAAISGVTYSNYGDMTKPLPVISGSAKNYATSTWTQVATNIWKCPDSLYNVGVMAFDHSGVIGDYDQLVGKKLFVANNTSLTYNDLNEDLEFFSDDSTSTLYLYSTSNPATRFTSIEIGTHGTDNKMLFTLCSAYNTNDYVGSNIVIDGLHFTYTGAHAVAGGGTGSTDNVIRNCVFDWIGGSKMNDEALYGNAIQFYGSTSNLTVENNWCYQIFDTGITFQATNATTAAYDTIQICDNLVEYTHWSIEFYNQNSAGTTQNITVDGNFCRFGGMGWGSLHRVEQHGADAAQDAGATLLCSWGLKTAPVNFKITNNIFDRSTGFLGLVQLLSGDESITFAKNTYIQIEDVNIGKLFGNFPTMKNAEAALSVIKEKLGDTDGIAVFVSKALHEAQNTVSLPTQSVTEAVASRKYFTGTTEQDPLQYQIGDMIIFNLSLRADGEVVSCPAIRWEAHTDDGHSYYGEASGKTGTVRIILPATGTGFVRLRCYAVDKNGTLINGVEQSTEINAANMFGAGVNVSGISQKWESANTEPADFDSYWNDQLTSLNAVTPDLLELTEDSRTNDSFYVYKVKIKCEVINVGEFVTGYITVPKNAAERSLKIKMYYFGYGTEDEYASKMPMTDAGAITFMVFAHSMELGQDPSVYAAALNNYGFSGNESADTSYFRGMILRDVQAVRFCMNYFGTAGVMDKNGSHVVGLNLWDGVNVNVSGGSQGGFQAIAVTALVPEVNSAYYETPWMCDVANATASDSKMQSVFRPAYQAGLAYFDSVSFAKRISRENVDFVILRAGLGDYVCPPSGMMALYDALDCPVTCTFTQGKTHGYTLPTTDGITLDIAFNKN